VPNPSVAALYEDALVFETGSAITSTGALTAYSGAKTGRSPLDKRIVKEPGSESDIWWGPVNKPMTPDVRTDFFNVQSMSFSITLMYCLSSYDYCCNHISSPSQFAPISPPFLFGLGDGVPVTESLCNPAFFAELTPHPSFFRLQLIRHHVPNYSNYY